MLKNACLAAIFWLGCCVALCAQVSRFDHDSEKWVANIDAVGHIVHFDPTKGNPSPSIYANDSDTGLPWYFVAPDCFLGNRAYAYGDSLAYDLLITTFSQTSYTNDIIIRTTDGKMLVHNHGFNPTLNKWTHFATQLLENQWHLNSGTGATLSQAEFRQALSNIESLEIRGEYRTGFDRAWLDNVWLGTVPDTSIAASICQGESLQIGQYQHTTPGIFLDELEDQSGCDSLLVVLDLEVRPSYSELLRTGFCPGGAVILPNGATTSAAGFFPFFYTAANGCDSTVLVQVEAWQPADLRQEVSICAGEKFALPNGSTTDHAGTFHFDFQTQHGCDSSLTIEIAWHDTAWTSLSARICGGEIFALPDGSAATEAGIYTARLQTEHGCDSTVVVDLEVLDSSLTIKQLRRCVGEKFALPDGTLAGEAGRYTFRFPNQFGCDSTVIFDLVFHPVFDTTLIVQLPEGTPYLLPDGSVVRDTALTKTYRFATPQGCDSTVTLRLDYVFYRVFAPNAIWPDDDGENDFFTLFTNDDALKIKQLHIYDRWGEQVFSAENFPPNAERLGWDGTFRGRPAPPGVFAWWAEIVFVDGRTMFLKGDVAVLR